MKKPWSVLICCCGLAAASIGISINSSGVFYTPVSKSLHMLRGTFSMHMTLFSLATAIMSLFVPKLYQKFSFKKILTISVIVAVGKNCRYGTRKKCHHFLYFRSNSWNVDKSFFHCTNYYDYQWLV